MGLNKLLELSIRNSLTFLVSLRFVTSRTDSSLFVYSRGTTLFYFLVYVDDLTIIGNDLTLVNTIIR